MKTKRQQSALLLAGAAAGAAAAWFGRRQLRLVSSTSEPVVEPTRAELPVGRSADPEIDQSLERRGLPQDETTGSALLGDASFDAGPAEAELQDIWQVELAEPQQVEGYDSLAPEDLGATWLERATQSGHEPHHAVLESGAPPVFEDAVMGEATLTSSHALEEEESLYWQDDDDEKDDEDENDENDENERKRVPHAK